MLTCSSAARKLWEKRYLTLKPVSVSKNRRRLTAKFYWLRLRLKAVGERTLVNIGAPPDCFAEFDTPGKDIKLWNCPTETKITSGGSY